jgi:predicted transcriptional regulator
MDSLQIVRTCYELQINNLNAEGWARKLKHELEKLGLVYIWQSEAESNANKICKVIRERCDDTEKLNVFSNISEKIPLIIYCEMKHE